MTKYILYIIVYITLISTLYGKPLSPLLDNGKHATNYALKVFYDNEILRQKIITTFEPLESDKNHDYIIVEVSAEEHQKLLDLKLKVEIDKKFTSILNPSLEALAKKKRLRTVMNTAKGGIADYPCYRTVEETFSSAKEMSTQYPNLVEWIDIGDSWKKKNTDAGYDMRVLVLTNKNKGGSNKPKLFITSSIHAREYTPAELTTRFAEYLLEHYDHNADITWMLDYHEVHILLQANPDGRKLAERQIFKRKNENATFCPTTQERVGVDLNRNFDFEWNTGGSSNLECSSIFHGPYGGSEPETESIQSYMKKLFGDHRADDPSAAASNDTSGIYFDIHSYSSLVLWPWGSREEDTPNNLHTLGRKLAYSNGYIPKKSIGLYPTSGTTIDYAYGKLGIPAYTFELGTDFFQECSVFTDEILPKNLPSLLYGLKAVRAPYRLPKGPEVKSLRLNGEKELSVKVGESVRLTAVAHDALFSNMNGEEPSQDIQEGLYYIDTPPWETGAKNLLMEAEDGFLDSKKESIVATIDTSKLSLGRHTIFVHARDDNNNLGVVSAIFLNITKDVKDVKIVEEVSKSLITLPAPYQKLVSNALNVKWKTHGASKHTLRVLMFGKDGTRVDVIKKFVDGESHTVMMPSKFTTKKYYFALILVRSYNDDEDLSYDAVIAYPPEDQAIDIPK